MKGPFNYEARKLAGLPRHWWVYSIFSWVSRWNFNIFIFSCFLGTILRHKIQKTPLRKNSKTRAKEALFLNRDNLEKRWEIFFFFLPFSPIFSPFFLGLSFLKAMRISSRLESFQETLQNEAFLAKAPVEVIESIKEQKHSTKKALESVIFFLWTYFRLQFNSLKFLVFSEGTWKTSVSFGNGGR